jgi:hypothetical protein
MRNSCRFGKSSDNNRIGGISSRAENRYFMIFTDGNGTGGYSSSWKLKYSSPSGSSSIISTEDRLGVNNCARIWKICCCDAAQKSSVRKGIVTGWSSINMGMDTISCLPFAKLTYISRSFRLWVSMESRMGRMLSKDASDSFRDTGRKWDLIETNFDLMSSFMRVVVGMILLVLSRGREGLVVAASEPVGGSPARRHHFKLRISNDGQNKHSRKLAICPSATSQSSSLSKQGRINDSLAFQAEYPIIAADSFPSSIPIVPGLTVIDRRWLRSLVLFDRY